MRTLTFSHVRKYDVTTGNKSTKHSKLRFHENIRNMMEATTNGGENTASLEDESPFEDGEKMMEGVEIATDEDAAAEEARKEEIRQQMTKVCACPLSS